VRSVRRKPEIGRKERRKFWSVHQSYTDVEMENLVKKKEKRRKNCVGVGRGRQPLKKRSLALFGISRAPRRMASVAQYETGIMI